MSQAVKSDKKTETQTAPTNNKTAQKAPVVFSVVASTSIPDIHKKGRESKYQKLYDAVKGLGAGQVIRLPIAKYTQVQAFRPTIEGLGYEVITRTMDGKLIAFIQLQPPKTEDKASTN